LHYKELNVKLVDDSTDTSLCGCRATESVLRRASAVDVRQGCSRWHVSSSGACRSDGCAQAPADCDKLVSTQD